MKKTPKIKITIIGLGLIGGSLGLRLKKKARCHITGFSLHKTTLKKAKQIGAIDKIANSIKLAVENADIVFIATPISVINKILIKISKLLKPKAIVTDVASIKESVIKQAEKILPKSVVFIGGHPMAGKEKRGIDSADINLLKNCFWVLVPSKNSKKADLNKLVKLIKQINCQPLIINPKQHDEAVALISHLPAILSSALCVTAQKQKNWSEKQKLAAEGFRDTSRLAANPPLLHTDFCLENKKNIGELIDDLMMQLESFKQDLKKNDQNKIFDFFQKAQRIRNNWFIKSRFAIKN